MPSSPVLFLKKNNYFLFLLFLFVATLLFNKLGTRLIDDLDRSWQYTLNYASSANLNYGTEIVFTYGPMGFISYLVEEGLAPGLVVLSWVIRATYVMYFFLYLFEIFTEISNTELKDLSAFTKFVLVPFMIISFGYFDYSIIIFICLIHSSVLEMQKVKTTILGEFFSRYKDILPIFIGCTTSLLFFIKVSYFPFIIAIPVIIILGYAKKGEFRKMIIFTSAILLAFCAVYFYFNITLKDYLLNSIEIISGYKTTMQMDFYKTYFFSYALSVSLILFYIAQLYFFRQSLGKNSLVSVFLILLSIYFLFAYSYTRGW